MLLYYVQMKDLIEYLCYLNEVVIAFVIAFLSPDIFLVKMTSARNIGYIIK